MAAFSTLADDIKNILELARYAPSVHNTQPWQVSVRHQTIHIGLNKKYLLDDGDPTGRETIISLGIFCEAIILSAEQLGYKLAALKFLGKAADISFKISKGTLNTDNLAELLKKRRTDRSVYKAYDISPDMVTRLKHSSNIEGVKIWVRTDQESLQKTAELTAKGIRLALSSPSFRKELSHYLTQPWSKSHRGISVYSLCIPRILAVMQPILMPSGITIGAEVKLEKKRWLSSSANIYIATRGDMPDYWFKTGRVYLRMSLQIEQLGLSQATSAATVEAADFHEDIEVMLGTDYRLQAVLRIGCGLKHHIYSPRISVETLLATSN